jgi:1-acyl-sn-glycerol-3-phosphate acyltransferase
LIRVLFRYKISERYLRRYCRPRQIERTHFFDVIDGACIVIGNHTSLSDGLLVLHALPERICSGTHSFWTGKGKSNFL